MRWTVRLRQRASAGQVRVGERSDQEQTESDQRCGTARRGSRPELWHRGSGPEVDVADAMEESFSDQRVKRFGSCVFVERPEAAGLRQRQRDSGVILELAADLSE